MDRQLNDEEYQKIVEKRAKRRKKENLRKTLKISIWVIFSILLFIFFIKLPDIFESKWGWYDKDGFYVYAKNEIPVALFLITLFLILFLDETLRKLKETKKELAFTKEHLIRK